MQTGPAPEQYLKHKVGFLTSIHAAVISTLAYSQTLKETNYIIPVELLQIKVPFKFRGLKLF